MNPRPYHTGDYSDGLNKNPGDLSSSKSNLKRSVRCSPTHTRTAAGVGHGASRICTSNSVSCWKSASRKVSRNIRAGCVSGANTRLGGCIVDGRCRSQSSGYALSSSGIRIARQIHKLRNRDGCQNAQNHDHHHQFNQSKTALCLFHLAHLKK